MTIRMTSESHILNIYEDHEMTFDSLFRLIEAVRAGTLSGCEEKLDGQHVSLTWTRQRGLLFFSKGVSHTSVVKGGDDEKSLQIKHGPRPKLLSSLLRAFRVMRRLCESDLAASESLFQDGAVVLEISVISREASNLILYREDQIRVIKATSLRPNVVVSNESLSEFLKRSGDLSLEVPVKEVPLVSLRPTSEIHQFSVFSLRCELEALLLKSSLKSSDTVGDIKSWFVRDRLVRKYPEFDLSVLSRVSERLSSGEKSVISKKDLSRKAWSSLQKIEKDRSVFLCDVLRPLECPIQQLGWHAIQQVEFEVGSNDPSQGQPVRDFVKRVREAYYSGKIRPGNADLEKIRVSLLRIGICETFFQKPVEGIVFPWDGKRLKLTGMFTAINQIHGLFTYGSDPARIVDP